MIILIHWNYEKTLNKPSHLIKKVFFVNFFHWWNVFLLLRLLDYHFTIMRYTPSIKTPLKVSLGKSSSLVISVNILTWNNPSYIVCYYPKHRINKHIKNNIWSILIRGIISGWWFLGNSHSQPFQRSCANAAWHIFNRNPHPTSKLLSATYY